MTFWIPIWICMKHRQKWIQNFRKNEFHWIIAKYVSELTLVLTGNHNLLNIEYYSKVLDNRFWYPVGY